MDLTAKQHRFCEEYLIDLNATQAAIRAGYSEDTAGSIGCENLTKPEIQARVAELQAERAAATRIDAAWLLSRLAEEAKADQADLYNEDGSLKPIREWPLIWRQGLVAGMEVDETYVGTGDERKVIARTRKVKISDRVKRLELIGRHIGVGAFKDVINLAGVVDVRHTIDPTGLTDEQLRVLASIPAQPK